MGEFRRWPLASRICVVALAALMSPRGFPQTAAVTVELGANFGEFFVINGDQSLSLNSSVAVQQKVDGKWVPVSVTNLYLRETCATGQPPRCRKLERGERIKAARWTGNFCSSQCPGPCRLDGPAPPGTYRFAVTSCDGKETFVSPDFEKPR